MTGPADCTKRMGRSSRSVKWLTLSRPPLPSRRGQATCGIELQDARKQRFRHSMRVLCGSPRAGGKVVRQLAPASKQGRLKDSSCSPSLHMGEALKSRVFLSADPLAGARVFPLAHPRTGLKVQFVRTAERLLEVQRFTETVSPRSWLLTGGGQDRVQQDGTLFLATPVDPLFLILPHLVEAGSLYRSLSDLIIGDDADALTEHICTLPRLAQQLVSPPPSQPSHH